MKFPAGWIVPDWPAPSQVRAVCTTRAGGASLAPYDTFNLGDHVGDDADRVARNRSILAGALDARPVFLQQVHGTHAIALDRETPDGTQADGCVTAQHGLACTIMVADCLPILLCTEDGRRVGAAHAGWRSLAGRDGEGIVEAVCRQMGGGELLAWLGPCIGPESFEVGPEVKAVFETHDARAATLFRPYRDGKWLADLPGLARLRLRGAGVTRIHGNDGSGEWDTVANPSRFFSHRRDRVSGRLAACIWRT